MSDSTQSPHGNCLANLDPDIIRRIIPVGQSHQMRLINKRWEALVKEYVSVKRPISSIIIHPGNDETEDMKVELRISESDLGYFDVAYWEWSGYKANDNGQTILGMTSPAQRIIWRFQDMHPFTLKRLLKVICLFPIKIYALFMLFFVVFPLLTVIALCLSPLYILYSFLRLPFDIYTTLMHGRPPRDLSWWRKFEKDAQKGAGPNAMKTRERLSRQLHLCSRVDVLRVLNVYLWTFDALRECLGSVQIDRLEVQIQSWQGCYPDFTSADYLRAFEADIRELALKHGVNNGIIVNGRAI